MADQSTSISSPFAGLSINNYYKFILVLAGIILILSLFVDAKGVNNHWLRNVAFWTILAALLIWFIHDILDAIFEIMRHDSRVSVDSYKFYDLVCFVVFMIFQALVWIFVFIMIVLK